MAESKNPSGVSTKSTPENNVFTFVKQLRENFENLSVKTIVPCLDADGNLYEKEVGSEELEKLRDRASVFVGAFIDYLKRADFTDSDKDKFIILLKLDGFANKDICAKMDLKASALRVRYARLTKKVYRDAFNQEVPPKNLVYLSDLKVISRAIARLNSRNAYYCLRQYIPFEFMTILKKEAAKTREASYVPEETEAESYYFALHTVYMCTTEFIKARFSQTTPDAIAKVLEILQQDGYSRVNAVFADMLRDSSEVAFMSDEQFTTYIREQIKDFKNELKGR